MSIDKYETLNQERKRQYTKRKVAASDNIESVIPTGSFTKYLLMKESLVQIPKKGKSLIA